MAENKAQGEWALPDGWAQATIGEIAERINSGFPSGKHNTEGIGVPHLRPMNISPNGEIDLSLVKYVEVSDYDALQEGDVLFNNTNSPVWLGKTAYIKKDTNWAYSNHMTRVRLQPEFDSGWVAYALHHLFLIGFFRMNCRHHVNQASINTNFLSTQTAIPIPPLAEQHHIVAEIETQFTRLDAAVAALEHVQANLRPYHTNPATNYWPASWPSAAPAGRPRTPASGTMSLPCRMWRICQSCRRDGCGRVLSKLVIGLLIVFIAHPSSKNPVSCALTPIASSLAGLYLKRPAMLMEPHSSNAIVG